MSTEVVPLDSFSSGIANANCAYDATMRKSARVVNLRMWVKWCLRKDSF